MANLAASDIQQACSALLLLADTTPIFGGTLTINGVSLGNYDWVKKTGNQIVSAFVNTDWFTATADSVSAFIIVNGDLTINTGQIFIPSNRKLFTVIYVVGTLTVNGQISMSARGANHSATGSNITAGNILIFSGAANGIAGHSILAGGSAGGAAISTGPSLAPGNPGVATTTGQTGGGGGGGWRSTGTSGAGAAGTSFTGGSAGGGVVGSTAGSGVLAGGAGGAAATGGAGNQTASGGAGNPGGVGTPASGGSTAQPGSNGTGGTLICLCEGNFLGTGTITTAGTNGGTTGGSPLPAADAGGGGSGGGTVFVLAGSQVGAAPAISALGGIGGIPITNGTSSKGGNGANGNTRSLIFDFQGQIIL